MSIFKNIVAAGLSVAILATPMVSSFRVSADAETPETTISETTEISGTTAESSTTEVSETTTETSETTTEQTTATTSAPVQTAGDADAYIDEVSELPDSYRLIVSADTDTSALTGAAGVAYDGSCILTFTSETDYNAAIAYFDANAISYATDGEVSLCGDGSEDVPTGTVSDNAAVKIAIIDTGSNVANESVSVLGGSLTDTNGHGTAMANYVLAQTDNAYILSVKAIGDNGKGSVTDVYAGVQYAIDADCDVILLAMSIPDSGNYDTFKSLIGQAEADGITVIASAGNNSADASAYLPAGIDGVTTV
ncbi:MAG: S8 family serine peptidase, partial [Mageeibacillus sp.]|nr:S8 family serine peptidase [Mageeibacillus sp.]MCI1264868.1 S8 family serine peptidase [Saccharofermentans sp.]